MHSPLSYEHGVTPRALRPGGFYPENKIRGEHVLFLASFHNNDATLSQFHVLNMLCESFIETLVSPPPPAAPAPRILLIGPRCRARASPRRIVACAAHGR